jgi:hypothetical protein
MSMKLYLLAFVLLGMAVIAEGFIGTDVRDAFAISSLMVFGIAVPRTLWFVWRNPKSVGHAVGEVAAKVDSFKDGFKDGRNK